MRERRIESIFRRADRQGDGTGWRWPAEYRTVNARPHGTNRGGDTAPPGLSLSGTAAEAGGEERPSARFPISIGEIQWKETQQAYGRGLNRRPKDYKCGGSQATAFDPAIITKRQKKPRLRRGSGRKWSGKAILDSARWMIKVAQEFWRRSENRFR